MQGGGEDRVRGHGELEKWARPCGGAAITTELSSSSCDTMWCLSLFPPLYGKDRNLRSCQLHLAHQLQGT